MSLSAEVAMNFGVAHVQQSTTPKLVKNMQLIHILQ